MNYVKQMAGIGLVVVLAGLAACESIPENLIKQPEVKLHEVEVQGLGFNAQTFLLTFDINNPNPFPLPVNHVSYGLKLDGQQFASGQTPGEVSVPASGATGAPGARWRRRGPTSPAWAAGLRTMSLPIPAVR